MKMSNSVGSSNGPWCIPLVTDLQLDSLHWLQGLEPNFFLTTPVSNSLFARLIFEDIMGDSVENHAQAQIPTN